MTTMHACIIENFRREESDCEVRDYMESLAILERHRKAKMNATTVYLLIY